MNRKTVIIGVFMLSLLAGCASGGSPEMSHAQRQQQAIVDLIADERISDQERERQLAETYGELMEVWRAGRHYGRYSTSDAFYSSVGYIYLALGSYFDSRNELSTAVPYWRDGADEALQAGIIDLFLLFEGRVIDNLIRTGQLERAELALHDLEHELLELLFRPDREALANSSDINEHFYYLTLEDFSLQLALHRDEVTDVARWRRVHERRADFLDRDPRLRFMQLRHYGGPGGAGTSLRRIDDEGSNRNPEWRPLYHLGLALSRDPGEAETVEAIIAELHRDFDHMEARVVERGTFSTGLDARYSETREAVRSGYWRHQTEAALRLRLGQVERAGAAVEMAAAAMSQVDEVYARVPSHIAVIDGVEADRFELVLLQAQIDEQLGRLDRSGEGYARFVEWSERNREALPPDQRQHFFESVARAGYLGQLRVAARRYLERSDDEAMARVLDASEQFRSRQLMEMLGTQASGIASLDEVRRHLGPGDTVLLFNDLDSHLLTVALDGRRHALTLIERPDDWNRRIFDIRNELAEQFRFRQRALAELVRPLFAGLDGMLGEADGLYVLTDGALSMLPASVLPMPNGEILQGERPLRYLPSLALLGESAPLTTAARTLFALGDPLFDPDAVIDEHIGRELVATTRSLSELDYLTPLPETRDEVEAIASILGGGDLLLGEQANRSALRTTDLSDYRYLHFATHGVLGDEIPDLHEPALVLAYESDEPNFLTASEVAGLSLNAEIAVLSACNTGNGEYFRGEGLMGLGRAFMVAGSRQVVVSLWPVDSHATERLMVSFYAALGEGLDAASALARAQEELQEMPMPEGYSELRGLQRIDDDPQFEDYRNPFFWSPFILIGT